MANQIATFFQSQPGDVAAQQTADHLKSFWDPRMRRAILAHLDSGGAGLSPVSAKAVALLRTASRDALAATLVEHGERTALSPGDDAG
jgi:formate dehydrogenase subunit delta